MNINISYNWLKEYLSTKKSPADLARLLSLSGPSVERIHHFGSEWDKIVVGKVLEIKPHPNADKLRIAITDIGSRKMEIVCGGTNLQKEMKVAVALSGARVRWHGEGELIELKPTEIRGVKSEAMIAAANEIGLFELFPHKEREVMDLSGLKAKPGAALTLALGLEDYVYDTEVTTNRPDLLGIIGFAREASAITREKFDEKKILSLEKYPKPGLKDAIAVKVLDKRHCPRYTAAVVRGVKVGPSPLWMRIRLARAGIRPISNIVDITNYVMLEMGEPMHAFDLKKLNGGIVARKARAGEKIKVLNGADYKLSDETLVIADAEKPIAIAGIMGGAETGVSGETTDIVLEAATFDPVSIRRSSRLLNLRSESSLRFEKGLSTDLPHRALARALQLVLEIAGGTCGPMSDIRSAVYKPFKFSIGVEEAQRLIGAPIAVGEMKRILTSLGFKLQATSYPAPEQVRYGAGKLQARVPYFRDHDIESGRDLAEEVARVYGYHKLPSVLPEGKIPLRERPDELIWEDKIKEALAGAGGTEIITYSFTSAGAMRKVDFDEKSATRIANPLTSDFEYMRTSLIPSALEVVSKNQENFPTVKLFEIANTYHPRKNDLPEESPNLLVAVSAKKNEPSPYYTVKGILELVSCRLGLDFDFENKCLQAELWHRGRSVCVRNNGKIVGAMGELHPKVLANFGIEHRLAALELHLGELYGAMREIGAYIPVPEFPAAKRDVSFIISERTPYEEVVKIMKAADKLIVGAELFDIFTGPSTALGAGKKSMAFHITYQSKERTLSSEEVEAAHKRLADMLKLKIRAEVRKG
ncbi:phenylalanine--tRNA ligase subunit beta [Candidatus Uhrbacteria bacterium]|nr:phenylalanine--tRNA ligase subunit beta [Candidatus Uhrbacteria bacterium]